MLGGSGLLDEVARAHPLSATQVDTYRLCPRKWGCRKLDGIEAPSNKFADFGNEVHLVQEGWLGKGVPPDLGTRAGKVAAAGIKLLPAPDPRHEVEREFSFESKTAIYRGKIDLVPPFDENQIDVFDHKTTSDLKWMKLPAALAEDVQATLYGIVGILKVAKLLDPTQGSTWPPENIPPVVVRKSWVYYLTGSRPAARKVQLVVLSPTTVVPPRPKDVRVGHFGVVRTNELIKRFDEIEVTAAEMLGHHRAGRKAMDLPYEASACDAFGGCPYRGNPCKLTGPERMRGIMAQAGKTENLLLDKMRASKAGNGVGAPAAEEAPTEVATAKPAASEASPEGKAEAASQVDKSKQAMLDALAKMRNVPGVAAPAQDALASMNPPDEPPLDAPDLPVEAPPAEAAARPGRGRPKGSTAQKLEPAMLFAIELVRAGAYRVDDPEYAKKVAAKAHELAKAMEEA